MPQTSEALTDRLRRLIAPGARHKLAARGLARGMIWRDGILPPGAPEFSPGLSVDLLDYGYTVLGHALRLMDLGGPGEVINAAFGQAAEAIESAVRRGDVGDATRGFHLVVSGAAFHLAHFSARSFCLLAESEDNLNLSSAERMLVHLIRRSLGRLRIQCLDWLHDETNSDESIAQRLREDDGFGIDEFAALAITRNFHRAFAIFEQALESGNETDFGEARSLLILGEDASTRFRNVPVWWINTLARHLIDDLWQNTLHVRLPQSPPDGDSDRWKTLRSNYIGVLSARSVAEVDLWPSQIEAAHRALDQSDSLVVSLPTSSGKTRIAEICALRALAAGRRVVYVTPLRALSAQVERVLARTFRPLGFSVSSVYGASGVAMTDLGTLVSADIVVATPEKLDFAIRQDPTIINDVALVILDEGHMIGLGPREVRYEVLVQRLLSRTDAAHRRLVCLSAIFSAGQPFEDFTNWLRLDNPGTPITSNWRPTRPRRGMVNWRSHAGRLDLIVGGERPFVPSFVQEAPPTGRRKKAFPADQNELVAASAQAFVADGQRVLIYCPQKRSVESMAQEFLRLNRQGFIANHLADRPRISRALKLGAEWLGEQHVAVKALEIGIAVHHGGLPRQFLSEVERLLNDKVLPIVIASPTLAQGVDLSCGALIFQSIYRNGKIIPSEEFANVIGRAGRAYVDLDGLTVFPVFEAEGSNTKRTDFNTLLSQSQDRQIESGILQLVEQLANILAASLQVPIEEVLHHVLNNQSIWEDGSIRDHAEQGESEEADQNEWLFAELDTAILSAIDNLSCSAEEVADLLDAALRSSLWSRRLGRCDEAQQLLQIEILHSRARWIWNNSSPSQRQGCFAAGIGYSAGKYIATHMDELVADLVRADEAFGSGNVDEAVEATTKLAVRLFETHPFKSKHACAGWKEALSGWLRGSPVGILINTCGGGEVEFIQQSVIYRLVWGIEAVRVQAHALGREEEQLFSGSTTMALTFGLPSVPAAVLMKAGLPSRSMAMLLVNKFPANFSDESGMRSWIEPLLTSHDPAKLWEDPDLTAIWIDFSQRWREIIYGEWVHTDTLYKVKWLPGKEPVAGTQVRIIAMNRGVDVCSKDFERLGYFIQDLVGGMSGQISATVSMEPGFIEIHRFGPSLPSS